MILGIDIGVQGAVAVLDQAGALVEVHDMPTLQDGPKGRRAVQRAVAGLDHLQEPCNRRLRRMRQCQARGRPYRRFCVWPRPCGVIEGVLAAAGVPITFITPPAWKRAIGLTLKSKDAARSEAIRRWPDHAALFARVKDDGRAESALIGVAGQTARRPWPSRVHLYAIGSAQGARAGLMNGADRKAVKSELRGHANG
jgi:crossover junction endodeoxyribonuclease RuvC